MLLLWRIFAFVKTDRDVVNSHSFLIKQFNHIHPCTIFRLCIFIFHLYCLKLLEEYDNMDMTKSDQIKAGLQKSFRSGKSAKASTVCYGYRATAEGDLIVYPAEAIYVFHIFERFAAGDSLGKISASLARMDVPSPTSKETISKILNNEKYLGDVIWGKTQFINGAQVKNIDLNAKTVMMSHHPAIITKELFELVQMEKKRRCRSHER